MISYYENEGIYRSTYSEWAAELALKYDEIKKRYMNMECSHALQGISTNMKYVKITGIGKEFEKDKVNQAVKIKQLLSGFYNMGFGFAMSYIYDGNDIGIYLGTGEENIDIVVRNLSAVFENIGIEYVSKASENIRLYSEQEIKDISKCVLGGVLKGDIALQEDGSEGLIDALIRGMQYKRFHISVVVRAIEKKCIVTTQNIWSEVKEKCRMLGNEQISFSESDKTYSYSREYSSVVKYGEIADEYSRKYSDGFGMGMWRTMIQIGVSDRYNDDAKTIAGIMTAKLYNSKCLLEPFHFMKLDRCYEVGAYTTKCDNSDIYYPDYERDEEKAYVFLPEAENMYTTEELGEIITFPSNDSFGFAVYDSVGFDKQRVNNGELEIGRILSSNKTSSKVYSVKNEDLTRHCLVVGLTGSGKTNTTMNLVCNINDCGIPMMVIEPAKSDYWKLYKYGIDNLRILNVGGVSGESLRINPFECPAGISIQTHIDSVFAAFKASFVLYPPMPFVLENAIVAIYEDRGWDIGNSTNRFGHDAAFPTIENLYDKIPVIVEQMGYDGETKRNIMGALHARINSLRIGSKGRVLNVKVSTPLNELFNEPTIIELDDLGDDDAKAFIMSLLLIKLSEYRRKQDDSEKLEHVLLIEEAHRLLKNVQGGNGESADPRANAVEFFCNLLAEMRSKGQGFVIVDQIPSKLAPDIIKNTNIKIAHRMVEGSERELLGGSMHMTEAQKEYLACLSQGVAAVYSEGDNRPKLVKPLNIKERIVKEKDGLTREEVHKKLDNLQKQCATTYCNQKDVSAVCSICPHNCDGSMCATIGNQVSPKTYKKIIKHLESMSGSQFNFTYVCGVVQADLVGNGIIKTKDDLYPLYCFMSYFSHKICKNDELKAKFASEFQAYMKEYGYEFG